MKATRSQVKFDNHSLKLDIQVCSLYCNFCEDGKNKQENKYYNLKILTEQDRESNNFRAYSIIDCIDELIYDDKPSKLSIQHEKMCCNRKRVIQTIR